MREHIASTANTHRAIEHWSQALGAAHVNTDPTALKAMGRSTYASDETIVAILRPRDRTEVQACVRIANDTAVHLYPISTGKNWGYGSAVPVRPGAAVLDLSRMANIVDYDDELGLVTIEPGVSQGRLAAFLMAQGGHHILDVTGSSPDCSVLANTLERGFGHSAYSDHFIHSAHYEVVLANGDILETGFGRFDNAKAAGVYRWGVGPSLDGLFTQSGFGIVTRMSIALRPTPAVVETFFFSIADDADLVDLITVLRPLRSARIVDSAVHIGNAYRAVSMVQQYPWDLMNGATPLAADCLAQLRKRWDIGAWNGSGMLGGTARQVAACRHAVKRALGPKVSRLRFLNDTRLRIAERYLGRFLPREMIDLAASMHGLKKGVPSDRFLNSAYWRKKTPAPVDKDLDRDGCGLIWVSPVIPMRVACVREAVDICTRTIHDHGFEPGMTLTLLNERALENVVSISYDRAVDGEDARAKNCANELLATLARSGYYPYRLATQEMHILDASTAAYRRFEENLRNAIDPNDILAPGRYEATS